MDVEYLLCYECKQYLTLSEKYQVEKYCWPSFICALLTNTECHETYHSNIWRMIPREFCIWWLFYCQSYFPDVYNNVTLDDPEPIFDDITSKVKTWNEKSATLPNFTHACNELIMPNIMCP